MKIFLVILFMQRDEEREWAEREKESPSVLEGAQNDKLQKFAEQHFALLRWSLSYYLSPKRRSWSELELNFVIRQIEFA